MTFDCRFILMLLLLIRRIQHVFSTSSYPLSSYFGFRSCCTYLLQLFYYAAVPSFPRLFIFTCLVSFILSKCFLPNITDDHTMFHYIYALKNRLKLSPVILSHHSLPYSHSFYTGVGAHDV